MPTLFSRARSSLTGLAVAAVSAATAFGAPPPGDPVAEPVALTRAPAAIWRLDGETSYQDPRGIILEESTRFRGTMAMSFRPAFSGNPGVYTIDRINWLVTVSNQTEEVYVTGYGTYQVTSSVGMLPVFGHRMMVDVR
ncbi:MAG TPA: hypothetical protein VEB22_00475, partial [Phycisphaerales bacterium]|nr:hypothetical protein [Phycisphaerales bacterium]